MPGYSNSVVNWLIDLESTMEEVAKRDQATFSKYTNFVKRLSEQIQNVLEEGEDSVSVYASAFSKLSSAISSTFGKNTKVLDDFIAKLDPAIIKSFGSNLFSIFTNVDTKFGELEPLLNLIGEKSQLLKEYNFLKSLAEKSGKDFALAFRASSDPLLRDLWKVLDVSPHSAELEKSIKDIITKAIVSEEDIPWELFESLANPKVLSWWLKVYSRKIKDSKDIKTALSKALEEGAIKGFFPKFAAQMALQGKRTKSMWQSVIGESQGKWEVFRIALGSALSDTTRIITSAITGIFEPFLEALSNAAQLSFYPLQAGLYELFSEIRPHLVSFVYNLSDLAYSLLPILKVAIKLLIPVFTALMNAIRILSIPLSLVVRFFSLISDTISGQLGPNTGFLGKVLMKLGDRLSWMVSILESFSWVLSVFVIPAILYYAWVLTVKATKPVLDFITTNVKLIRSLIVSAASWMANKNIISLDTYESIKNFEVKKLLESFTSGKLIQSIKKLWDVLIGERLEYARGRIEALRKWTAQKQLAQQQTILEAQTKAAASGQRGLSIAVSKTTLALGALSAGIALVSLWNADWSDSASVISNLLVIFGSVVLPLLSVSIKGVSVAQWIMNGAFAAFNMLLNMSPIGWIITLIGLLVAGITILIYRLYGRSPGLIPGLQIVGELFTTVFSVAFFPLTIVIKLIGKLVEALYNMSPISGLIDAIRGSLERLAVVFGPILSFCYDFVLSVSTLAEDIVSGFENLYAWIEPVIAGFGKVSDVVMGIFGWTKNNWPKLTKIMLLAFGPIGWIILSLSYLFNNWEKVTKAFMSGFQSIGKGFDRLWGGFISILEKVKNFVKYLISWIPGPIRWWFGLNPPEDVKGPEIDQDSVKANVAEAAKAVQAEVDKTDPVIKKMIGVESAEVQAVQAESVRAWQKQGQTSGEALAQTFAQGQVDNTTTVAKATEQIAVTASAYLPGSDAEVGPLSEISESGGGFIDTFTQGIVDNKGYLAEALSRVFAPLLSLVPAPIRSLLTPEASDVNIEFDLEEALKSGKFAEPIVKAIDDQTRAVLDFMEEIVRRSKDLDVSNLDALSRFEIGG